MLQLLPCNILPLTVHIGNASKFWGIIWESWVNHMMIFAISMSHHPAQACWRGCRWNGLLNIKWPTRGMDHLCFLFLIMIFSHQVLFTPNVPPIPGIIVATAYLRTKYETVHILACTMYWTFSYFRYTTSITSYSFGHAKHPPASQPWTPMEEIWWAMWCSGKI
jgi:hypothetical protein